MTPYRYFANKGAILAALRANVFDCFSERLESARNTFDVPARSGHAVGETCLRFAPDEPDACRLISDLAQPGESEYPALQPAGARWQP